MAKKNTRQTSRRVASKASRALKSRKTSPSCKSVAGSALSQTKPRKRR